MIPRFLISYVAHWRVQIIIIVHILHRTGCYQLLAVHSSIENFFQFLTGGKLFSLANISSWYKTHKIYLLLLKLQFHRVCLLIMLTSFVLKPNSDHARRKPRHIHELLLHQCVWARVNIEECTVKIEIRSVNVRMHSSTKLRIFKRPNSDRRMCLLYLVFSLIDTKKYFFFSHLA